MLPRFVSLCAALFTGALSAQDFAEHLLYSVPNPTPGQRLRLQQQFDVLGACCGSAVHTQGDLDVVVSPNEVPGLLALAPTAKFVRAGAPYARNQPLPGAGPDVPDPGYYTVAEIEAAIDAQVAAHPALARKVNLSTLPGGVLTHDGRPVFALKVSDNVASDEDEPAMVIAAQHHARELNSPVMVLGAMQRVLAGYGSNSQLAALVNGYELYFVPMVNPDGVNHVWTSNDLWRKNRRNNGGGVYGVDLNRNYPFLWSACGASATPSSDTYSGPAAGSEPEVVTLRNLVARLRPEVYLDFHSYGQQVLRTYAPCATVHATMASFLERYVDNLRAPMTYGKRDPSASGEAPEDHYASGGTLSFLIEVGTAFQPAYSTTVTEEARVWPGIQRVFTTWRPALRGHVRSSLGSAPLAATITFSPNLFSHGERTLSRDRDGRYGLWLPLGTWNVTFSAPDHQSQTVPVTVTSYDTPATLDVTLVSTCTRHFPDSTPTGSSNLIPFGTTTGSSLTSTFVSNNGGSVGGAVYGNVTPAAPLYLTGLELNTSAAAGTPVLLDVYRTALNGGYGGNEGSSAAWTPIGVGRGVSAGQDVPTVVELTQPTLLQAGSYGLAIVARNFAHRYTNGTGSNQTYSDANLTAAFGAATNTPFGGSPFSPRVANVTLKYLREDSSWVNQRYQTILRREDLRGAGPITGIAFAAATSQAHWNNTLLVRMANVPAGTVLSTTFGTNLPAPTTVLSASNHTWHTTADTWTDLGFQTPFVYNGTGDVVVDVIARGNVASLAAGAFRSSPNQERVYDYGWTGALAPTSGTYGATAGLRMRVHFHCATGTEFGTACGPMRNEHFGTGARGTTFYYDLYDAVPSSGAIVALGFQTTAPYPTSLSPYGLTNCFAFHDAASTVFRTTNASGFATHPIAAPSSAAFDGLKIFGQWYQPDASQPGGLTVSGYTRWQLGIAP